jgi:hypothetical protein
MICLIACFGRPSFIIIAFAQLFIHVGWFIVGRLEIREQGIILSGHLLRWGNIESYEWTSQVVGWGKPTPVVLKVHVRRLLKALPPARIPVPPERREAVDAVLSRYLSDWPGAASSGLPD